MRQAGAGGQRVAAAAGSTHQGVAADATTSANQGEAAAAARAGKLCPLCAAAGAAAAAVRALGCRLAALAIAPGAARAAGVGAGAAAGHTPTLFKVCNRPLLGGRAGASGLDHAAPPHDIIVAAAKDCRVGVGWQRQSGSRELMIICRSVVNTCTSI